MQYLKGHKDALTEAYLGQRYLAKAEQRATQVAVVDSTRTMS